MAFWITAIREFENLTPVRVQIYSVRTRELVRAEPGKAVSCNMWIPWADTARQFAAGERIEVQTPGYLAGGYYIFPQTYHWIWQQGDFVRCSKDGQFHFNGEHVPGDARIDGDRVLQVSASNGSLAISLRA